MEAHASDMHADTSASVLGHYRQFRLLAYANGYYGVPAIQGPQHDSFDPDATDGLLRAKTLDELKSLVDGYWSGAVPDTIRAPFLIEAYRSHNIVGYLGAYYAAPFGLPVDWGQVPEHTPNGLFRGDTLEGLRQHLDASGAIASVPRSVGEYRKFNLVLFRQRCYGVPQEVGSLEWDRIDLEHEPSLVVGDNDEEVRRRIDDALDGGHRFFYLRSDPHHRGLADHIATDQPLSDLGLPEIIEIEPIHTCNLRCVMCHVSYEKLTKQRLDIEKTLRHMEGLSGRWAMLSSSYEPFAHPQIIDLIQGLDGLGMKIDMTTNGTLFTPRVIDQIKDADIRFVTVSFDGIRKATYESIRGRANYDVALERIMAFKRAFVGKDTYFNVNQTLMRRNLSEVGESVAFWNDADFDHMGLILMRVRNENDVLIRESLSGLDEDVEAALNGAARQVIEGGYRIVLSSPVYARSSLKSAFPANFVGSSVFSDNPGYRIPVNPRDYYQNGSYPGMPVNCRSPFKFAKIDFNGDVVLCQKFRIGNINDAPFLDIWYGREAERVRNGVMRQGNERTCLHCHHYRFCIRAGEIDVRNSDNFVALSRPSVKASKTEIDIDDGTPVFLGVYRSCRLYRWGEEFFASSLDRNGAHLMLDPFWRADAHAHGRSLDEVKAGVDRKIATGVKFGPGRLARLASRLRARVG